MARTKGGGKAVSTKGKRVVVIPDWRDEPDIRLFAVAVVEIARQAQRKSKQIQPESQSEESKDD